MSWKQIILALDRCFEDSGMDCQRATRLAVWIANRQFDHFDDGRGGGLGR